MKKLVVMRVLVVLLLAVPILLKAQRPEPPSEEQVEADIQKLAQELRLDGSKKDKFVQIERQFHKEAKAAHEKRQRPTAAIQKKDKQMKQLLTAEQYKKYTKKMEERKKQHDAHRR